MADEPDNVIPFVSMAQREQLEQQRTTQEIADYAAAAHEEAVSMLEEALRFVRENPNVASVAIAYSFFTGSYATQIPRRGDQMGALIGATAALTFKLQMKDYSA